MFLEWLGNWLKQIIILIIIATLIDLILPNRSMERYVKLVMGLLMIMAILTPILQLIGKENILTNWGVEFWNKTVKEEARYKQYPSMKEIEAASQSVKQQQEAFVQQQVARQIEHMVTEQVESRFSMKVHHCDVKLKEEAGEVKLEKVRLILSKELNEAKESDDKEIIAIRPIEIGQEENNELSDSQEDKDIIKNIQNFISEMWHLDRANIEIQMQT